MDVSGFSVISHGSPGGVRQGDQPQICHEFLGVLRAAQVPEFTNFI